MKEAPFTVTNEHGEVVGRGVARHNGAGWTILWEVPSGLDTDQVLTVNIGDPEDEQE